MKPWIACGVAALAVAGCSSDAASAPTTAPPVVVTTTSASSIPDATTTSSTTTTTTTSTTSTTTLPETTTTLPTEALIKQAVQDYIAAYFACGQAPAQCDPTTFTATQGPSRATVTELIDGMKAQGLHFSTDLRGSYLVAESVSKTSDVEATADYCAYDALTVLGPNGPDGLPTVVNDEVISYQYQYRTYLEGDEWRVGEQHELQRLGGGNLCPPAA